MSGRRPHLHRALAAFALLLLLPLPSLAGAADLPGWDDTHWGMSSAELARQFGDRAKRLTGRIEFAGLYSDVVLRHEPFAGLDFTVYFQMDDRTGRLAAVLLERRRQYATPAAWRDTVAALKQRLGPPTAVCDRRGAPAQGKPTVRDRVWIMPTTTVRASYLDFSAPVLDLPPGDYAASETFGGALHPYRNLGMSRRLLVRYAPTRPGAAACP